MRLPLIVAAICLLGTLGWSAPARAAAPVCSDIEERYRRDPRPETLAACEAERGRIATAIARYDEALALIAALPKDSQGEEQDREKAAREHKAALLPDVPLLTLKLPKSAPQGTVVARDGAALAPAALGVAVPLDPGEHVVSTQAPGGPMTEIHVTLRKGEKKQLTLPVQIQTARGAPLSPTNEALERPPATAPPEDGPSGRRVGAWVAGGLGLAGLAIGGVMGGLAIGRKGVVDHNCQDTICNEAGKAAADSLKRFGLASTIGFSAGIAGAGIAAVLFLTEPARRKRTAARQGRWVSAAGGMVGIQGGW